MTPAQRFRGACSLRRCWPWGHLSLWPPLCHPLGLESDLSVRLHGQHLAQELVLTTVRSYLELPRPDKALALSFHGWSGTGKNFVARMLAENLYRDGQQSACVQVFITMLHFPHPQSVHLYKVRLGARRAALCAGREALKPALPRRGGPWSSLGVGAGGQGAVSTEPGTHTDEALTWGGKPDTPNHLSLRCLLSSRTRVHTLSLHRTHV